MSLPEHLVSTIRGDVLPRFGLSPDATLAPLGTGLINQTFRVTTGDQHLVLQRVNAIFPAAIHDNIAAVTAALTRAGLLTPVLVPTTDGRACLELPGSDGGPSVWRVMTEIDAESHEVVGDAAQARSAGALVARFHRALDGLSHAFVGLRTGVHDTPAHMARLTQAVAEHQRHRLFAEVAPLAHEIQARAAVLPPLPVLPARICHGDLKFNNIMFARGGGEAICLIDLDTVGPQPLAFEWGDAWRSWCNRAGEDTPDARLDLDVFAASWEGYRDAFGRALSEAERRALLLGPEWISLELAARFAADALREAYFGWDPQRFAGRGEHNLIRARGQWSLHQKLVASRDRRAGTLSLPDAPVTS